jgi:hypothetical protein
VNLFTWETPDHLNGGIDRFITHYNARWHHETLGNVTLDDVYYGWRESMLARRAKLKEETLSRRKAINNQPQGPDGDKPYLNSDSGNCHSV